MRRFLWLWLVLSVPLSVATITISVLWFRHLDLTFDYFAQLIVVPICQAIALAVTTASFPSRETRRAVHETVAHPLVIPVLVMDAGLLSSGWLLGSQAVWGIGGATSLHVSWIATKAGAAGLFLLFAAARAARASPLRRHWSIGDRMFLAGFALFLLALGINGFAPWLSRVPDLVLGGRAVVLQWLASYSVMFLVGMALALKAADTLRRHTPVSAVYIEAAAAMAFGCAVLLVLNAFERRFVPEPWLSVIRTAASVGATFALIGAITGTDSAPDAARRGRTA